MNEPRDLRTEDWITSLHEAAHVVFAVLAGRRVQWVTIEAVVVTTSGGDLGVCLGRWDTADSRPADGWGIGDRRRHIQLLIAGYLMEYLVTGVKNGMDDEKAALRCCTEAGLDLAALERETIALIGERSDRIHRLARMLMEHRTLDEARILEAVVPQPSCQPGTTRTGGENGRPGK